MDLLDVFIVLVVAGLAARGWQSGFFREAGSLLGFVIGLVVGAVLAPLTTSWAQPASLKLAIGLITVFGAAGLVGAVGEAGGRRLGGLVRRFRLEPVDAVAGAVFGVVVGLITVWLLTALTVRLPWPPLQRQLQRSAVLRALDHTLPPAPEVIARFGRIVAPNGFPQVFSGLEPVPAPSVSGPAAAAVNRAAAIGRPSTVQLEGAGCGGVVEGSGFVAAADLVVTNAHVVAGIRFPVVVDSRGPHAATPVLFDPDLDLAILRVRNLAGPPLPLGSTTAPRGTVGAALGFPGGGPFNVSPAAVTAEHAAIGRNIYDHGLVRRDIYELQTDVRPGNSGGPLITPDGVVIGVIFATSLSDTNVGYALTSPQVITALGQARTAATVSTGACAAN